MYVLYVVQHPCFLLVYYFSKTTVIIYFLQPFTDNLCLARWSNIKIVATAADRGLKFPTPEQAGAATSLSRGQYAD